jgi:transcriptional regulator of met regulon
LLFAGSATLRKEQHSSSADTFLHVLRSLIQEFPQVYVTLDALDECEDREELIRVLKAIAGWNLQNLHLLVTSRKERDIEIGLETFIKRPDMICLQTDLVDLDIRAYVQQRLTDDGDLRKWQKDGIRQEIEDALMKGSRGMYYS